MGLVSFKERLRELHPAKATCKPGAPIRLASHQAVVFRCGHLSRPPTSRGGANTVVRRWPPPRGPRDLPREVREAQVPPTPPAKCLCC